MITPEQAFEKWWQGYESDSVGGYDPYEKEVHMHQAFLAGIQYKELHQIGVLADIRKAVGDGEGKLMQDELVKRIEGLVKDVGRLESAIQDLKRDMSLSNQNLQDLTEKKLKDDLYVRGMEHSRSALMYRFWQTLKWWSLDDESVITEKEEA